MKLFVGLDVSLAKTPVCVINEHGKIAKEAQVPNEPQAIVDFLNSLEGPVAIIRLEDGPLSQWLHRGLADAGLDVVLMEPRQVKGALKAMPIKTARRDAEGIARLLHLGWFMPVHCKSVSAQQVRAFVRPQGDTTGHDRAGAIAARTTEELWSEGRHYLARPVRCSDQRIGGRQFHVASSGRADVTCTHLPAP